MFCTACAAFNARHAHACISCGHSFAHSFVSSPALNRSERKRRPRRQLHRLLLSLPLVVLVVPMAIGVFRLIDTRLDRGTAYAAAVDAFAAGDLPDAQRRFAALGDYRDTETYLADIAATLAPHEAAVELARALATKGRYDEAIAQVLPVVTENPHDTTALDLLAELRGHHRDALVVDAALAESERDWLGAERALTALVRNDPTDARTTEQLATLRRTHAPLLYARDGIIYRSEPDGSDERAVTPALNASWPAWSPTRNQIAFIRRIPGSEAFDTELMVINGDGTNLRTIAKRITPYSWPSWSPDGRTIAFASAVNYDETLNDGTIELHIVDLITGTETDLTGGHLPHAYSPTWSPDGSRLAFVSYRLERRRDGGVRPADGEVYTIDIATGVLTDVTHGDVEDESLVSWSPVNDQLLIFTIPDDWNTPRPSEILILDLPTSTYRKIPITDWQVSFPVWSPDGTTIAFVEGDHTVRFWSEERESSVEVETDLSAYLSWSPDGSALLVAADLLGAPSAILPMGEEFGTSRALDLDFSSTGNAGPPLWSPITRPIAPPSSTLTGTARDSA